MSSGLEYVLIFFLVGVVLVTLAAIRDDYKDKERLGKEWREYWDKKGE